MKKILFFVSIVVLTLGLFNISSAQQNQCAFIGASNYQRCCSASQTFNDPALAQRCDNYINSQTSGGGGGSGGQSGDPVIIDPILQNQCALIGTSNYSRCCTAALTFNNPQLAQRCDNYINSQTPGTIGGGTQNTNPTGNTGTPGTIAPTPQASSSALASCNLIAFDSLLDILIWLKCVIGAAIIPLIFTIAFLLFLWGMVQYIRNADNEKKREESKKFIYYGIIGLTVMVAVWGIVRIVTTTFGLGDTVPQLQTDCLSSDKDNPCK